MDPRVRAQTILYETPEAGLRLFLRSIGNLKVPEGLTLALSTGDCSLTPCLTEAFVLEWQTRLQSAGILWTHMSFRENLGYGRGHNRLASHDEAAAAFLMINPDCVAPPNMLERLWSFALSHHEYGMVESRQVPLEHPKQFDPQTRETSWSSGACVLVKADPFRKLGGFDEQFFMYGEDVDLSWRIRGLGLRCYYCVDSFVYHAKGLNRNGIVPGPAELLHGALGQLIVLEKYGRQSLAGRLAREFAASKEPLKVQASTEFLNRRATLTPASASARRYAEITPEGGLGAMRWGYAPPPEGFYAES